MTALANERELPRSTLYYYIENDGTVVESAVPVAESYIDARDVDCFCDQATMLHIRTVYGPHIGVMRELKVSAPITREVDTPKMLLGFVKA